MLKTFFLLLFLPLFCQAEIAKVLIAKDISEVLLEAKGRFTLYHMPQEIEIAAGSRSKRQMLTLQDQGFTWGEEYKGIYYLKLVPSDGRCSFLMNGIEYKGNILIYGIEGKIFAVNEIDMESYLKSTLQAEIDPHFSQEVLEAVAVAMRTSAYYQIKQNQDKRWHFEATNPPFMGAVLLKQKNNLVRAIDSTAEEMLTYAESPFATHFSEDCAGKTAAFSQIFGQEGICPPGIAIPVDLQTTNATWRLSVEKYKLQKLLSLLDIDTLDCSIDEHSGKVHGIRFIDKTPVARQIDFFTLQAFLGKDKLLSNDFICTLTDDAVIFEGKGKGLGVGICLKTAQILANQKKNYKEILKFFYPETSFWTISKEG